MLRLRFRLSAGLLQADDPDSVRTDGAHVSAAACSGPSGLLQADVLQHLPGPEVLCSEDLLCAGSDLHHHVHGCSSDVQHLRDGRPVVQHLPDLVLREEELLQQVLAVRQEGLRQQLRQFLWQHLRHLLRPELQHLPDQVLRR